MSDLNSKEDLFEVLNGFKRGFETEIKAIEKEKAKISDLSIDEANSEFFDFTKLLRSVHKNIFRALDNLITEPEKE